MPEPPDDGRPFVARERELAAVTAAVRGHGAVVLVGAAGVGKSRLAREAVAALRDPTVGHGFAVATASARPIPLGALARWLETGTADPGTADAHPRAEPDASLLHRAVRALRAPGPRWILAVDDVHHLDAVSAAVLHHLALERAVRLVLTVRAGETVPDAVAALWRDRPAVRVDLDALGEEGTRALVDAVLGGPVDGATGRRLHAVTRGNVLWLRHLLEGERAAGRLAVRAGLWRWAGPEGLAPALADLVAEDMGELTGPLRRVLELLAFSEPLGLELLRGLAGGDAVEEAAERGLVRVEADGARHEVRIGHPLYGEAVRAGTSVPRAQRLRGELAAALAATGGRRAADDLRRAVLGMDSDTRPGADVLVRAARLAVGLSDLDLGERLFRAAGAAGGFEARIGLASVLMWVVRVAEAESEMHAAVTAAATDDERLRAALFRAQFLFFHREDAAAAHAVLDDAAARVDRARAGLVDAGRATLVTAGGDLAAGERLVGRVLAVEGAPAWATAWAGWAAAYGRALAGRTHTDAPDLVPELVRRGVAAAREHPETIAMQHNVAFAEVLGACLDGDPGGGRARIGWLAEQPGPAAAGFSALLGAYLELARGRPRTTITLVHTVLPMLPGHGGGWSGFLRSLLAQAHGMLGEAGAARAAAAEADELAHRGLRAFEPHLGLGRAWAAAGSGALGDAREHAARAATRAAASGQSAVEVLARHTAVRFGDRHQAGRLAELARELAGPAASTAASHAAALGARDDVALLAVAEQQADAGRDLVAADAAAQAATLAHEDDRAGAAAVAAARATELAAPCEGACTPALGAIDVPLDISDRAREIALLAVEGLTNRRIAERLGVSVRTVESHIYRACARLGLADRAELVAVVTRGRPPAGDDALAR